MAVEFDAHLPQLYDDHFVAGSSQAEVKNAPWFVHFNAGFESQEQNVFELRCLVANNEDHCQPNLFEDSLEYIVKIPKPFEPVRFQIWTPGKTESYVCLVTFELMRAEAERPDIDKLNDVPFVNAQEQQPSLRWHWKDLPF